MAVHSPLQQWSNADLALRETKYANMANHLPDFSVHIGMGVRLPCTTHSHLSLMVAVCLVCWYSCYWSSLSLPRAWTILHSLTQRTLVHLLCRCVGRRVWS